MLRRQFDQVSFIISHECWREIRISGEIIKGCGRNLPLSECSLREYIIFCSVHLQNAHRAYLYFLCADCLSGFLGTYKMPFKACKTLSVKDYVFKRFIGI